MRPLDAVLQDASAMLGQVGALLELCRALRLELDAERTPAPDVTAQAERAVYLGIVSGRPILSHRGRGSRATRGRPC